MKGVALWSWRQVLPSRSVTPILVLFLSLSLSPAATLPLSLFRYICMDIYR